MKDLETLIQGIKDPALKERAESQHKLALEEAAKSEKHGRNAQELADRVALLARQSQGPNPLNVSDFDDRLSNLYAAAEDALPSLSGVISGHKASAYPREDDRGRRLPEYMRWEAIHKLMEALWAAARVKPCEVNGKECGGACWPCTMRRQGT